MNDPPRRADRSWWLEEVLAFDPGAPCPPLAGDLDADVVILGGGYTGLWTAHFLKDREPGLDIVVLEQDICGGGPSGRNGGFLNGWWSELDELVDRLGVGQALAVCRTASDSVREIGLWCERHGVDAWYTHAGDVGVATSPAQDGEWRSNLRRAQRLGFREQYVELTAAQVRERCDTPLARGGLFTPDAATVQPARLARGLRRVVLEQGVRIFEGTPVERFRAGPPAVAGTAGGMVRARQAVVALNAWASHWKAFRRWLAVRGTYMVITAPAPEKLEQIRWTGGEGVWNFRSAVHYLRTTRDGRIAFGAGGMQPKAARRIGPAFQYDERFVRQVAEDLWRWFPSFRDVPLEAAWGGPVDVSGHHLPFFGSLPSGNVHYGLGYTGNGVGPCHLGGKILARLVLGVEDELTRLPLVTMEPMRFPPEPILSPGLLVANGAILRKDRAEDRGRKPNPLVAAAAKIPRNVFGYNLGP